MNKSSHTSFVELKSATLPQLKIRPLISSEVVLTVVECKTDETTMRLNWLPMLFETKMAITIWSTNDAENYTVQDGISRMSDELSR